ncbi:hypothetical protein ACFSQP_10115 [Bizionia sediminis]|uniref:Uncharacterized protein n=1 Tax=Bizionia sediminis TaxID=1737064 RepID=A0ABW5KVZ1_9FLAO
MKTLYVLVSLLFASLLHAQQINYGPQFPFNPETENDLQFVLSDNYNSYLFSQINMHGMQSKHALILRKLDQTNTLVATYEHTFPGMGASSLYNFLGVYQRNANQLVAYTHAYSGKMDKMEVYEIVFHKTTNTFAERLIFSHPIESNSKSGNVAFKVSENGLYAGLIYTPYAKRKEPAKSIINLYNTETGERLWDKEVVFEDTNEKHVGVTNSGSILWVRTEKGFKAETNQLFVVNADQTKRLLFPEKTALFQPKLFSIGNQDYFMAFYEDKSIGLKFGKFNRLLMYSLTDGSILNNNKIDVLTQYKSLTGVAPAEITDVKISELIVGNNSMHVILETLYKAGTVQKPMFSGSSTTMEVDLIKYGVGYVLETDMAGKVLQTTTLKTSVGMLPEISNSFGIISILGDFYINTGWYYGLYKPSQLNGLNENYGRKLFGYSSLRDYGTFVNQLMHYSADSRILKLARYHSNNSLSVMDLTNFPE